MTLDDEAWMTPEQRADVKAGKCPAAWFRAQYEAQCMVEMRWAMGAPVISWWRSTPTGIELCINDNLASSVPKEIIRSLHYDDFWPSEVKS